MINRLEIDRDLISKHALFSYCTDLYDRNKKKKANSQFPETVVFKPGVNILCGINGSGKTTILNMLKLYTLTEKFFYSEWPTLYQYSHLENMFKDKITSVHIYADYRYVFFNFRIEKDIPKGEGWLENMANFKQAVTDNHISRGQSVLHTFDILLDFMFGEDRLKGDTLKFPLEKIKKLNANTFSAEYAKYASDYFYKHMEEQEIHRFTILMDEPDNNLDIFNIDSTFSIYSVERPDTQIIASLHNPVVLYRLAIQKNPPNFIELTPGYVNKVIEFVEKGKRMIYENK